MSTSPVSTITRASVRRIGDPLNILTFPTHERYETLLCTTGHNFYSYRADGIKDWNQSYASIPDNYQLLDKDLKESQIPLYLDFDLILSQNKFGQYQIAHQFSKALHVPLINLEHTLPVPSWSIETLQSTHNMRGHVNVFISEYSIGKWQWVDNNDTTVVHHGVDCELFKPDMSVEKDDRILSVVNDWINRDWCCGFNIWQRVANKLPTFVVGDTPGLSEPAKNTEELVKNYQTSRIFLNTSTISPVPTALLEAMACGCAVVSTATCMIPEIITNGINGFVSNDEKELEQYLIDLLNDEELAQKMGNEARKTIEERFSQQQFVTNWDNIFQTASQICFRG
tara:strand:+ start:1061 stop:2080 length:1020 start_codon:yes stop_codon:yes gene_type:complete